MKNEIHSSYVNFVQSDSVGTPQHYSNQQSWQHLSHLLKTAAQKLHGDGLSPNRMFKAEFTLDIIGFSKGCVPLNQLVYDMDGLEDTELADSFVGSVGCMYWLDGGHLGDSEMYVSKSSALAALASKRVNVQVHVTPYTMNMKGRLWMRREYYTFTDKLIKLGADLSKTFHFEGQGSSIENHFRVLQEFKQNPKQEQEEIIKPKICVPM